MNISLYYSLVCFVFERFLIPGTVVPSPKIAISIQPILFKRFTIFFWENVWLSFGRRFQDMEPVFQVPPCSTSGQHAIHLLSHFDDADPTTCSTWISAAGRSQSWSQVHKVLDHPRLGLLVTLRDWVLCSTMVLTIFYVSPFFWSEIETRQSRFHFFWFDSWYVCLNWWAWTLPVATRVLLPQNVHKLAIVLCL